MIYSDIHTKLVWTLNFYLIETTSKFVPDCNLLSNTIISANNILKNTKNLEQYLCILHVSKTGQVQYACFRDENCDFFKDKDSAFIKYHIAVYSTYSKNKTLSVLNNKSVNSTPSKTKAVVSLMTKTVPFKD